MPSHNAGIDVVVNNEALASTCADDLSVNQLQWKRCKGLR